MNLATSNGGVSINVGMAFFFVMASAMILAVHWKARGTAAVVSAPVFRRLLWQVRRVRRQSSLQTSTSHRRGSAHARLVGEAKARLRLAKAFFSQRGQGDLDPTGKEPAPAKTHIVAASAFEARDE